MENREDILYNKARIQFLAWEDFCASIIEICVFWIRLVHVITILNVKKQLIMKLIGDFTGGFSCETSGPKYYSEKYFKTLWRKNMMSLLLKIDEFVRITSNKTLSLYLQDIYMLLIILIYIHGTELTQWRSLNIL